MSTGRPDREPDLPPGLSPGDRAVLFDGECVLCSGGAQLLMRIDRRGVFRLGTVQSPEGQAILRWHGLPTDAFDSFVLCEGPKLYLRSTAFVRIAARLGLPWNVAALLWGVPRPLRDWGYDWVARNRFRLFGRRDACMVLPPQARGRLLDSAASSERGRR